RQWAVKEMLSEIDVLLVIGSRNSSNSNRLVETARAGGVPAYLIDDETEIEESWVADAEIVGITSGASAPEKLVARVCDWFRACGVERIEAFRMVDEDVTFKLPVELRRELELAARAVPVSSQTLKRTRCSGRYRETRNARRPSASAPRKNSTSLRRCGLAHHGQKRYRASVSPPQRAHCDMPRAYDRAAAVGTPPRSSRSGSRRRPLRARSRVSRARSTRDARGDR